MTELKDKFTKEIRPTLMKELGFSSIEATPKIVKIVVSSKTGRIKEDDKAVAKQQAELSTICGQFAKINKSKKAVSSFKLRIGQPVGLTCTLRSGKMYDFITRFVVTALPRVRDFKGLSLKGFDKNGNYTIGVTEHTIIPEIKYESVSNVFGFQINIHTTARNKEECYKLLQSLGFPFEKDNSQGAA